MELLEEAYLRTTLGPDPRRILLPRPALTMTGQATGHCRQRDGRGQCCGSSWELAFSSQGECGSSTLVNDKVADTGDGIMAGADG